VRHIPATATGTESVDTAYSLYCRSATNDHRRNRTASTKTNRGGIISSKMCREIRRRVVVHTFLRAENQKKKRPYGRVGRATRLHRATEEQQLTITIVVVENLWFLFFVRSGIRFWTRPQQCTPPTTNSTVLPSARSALRRLRRLRRPDTENDEWTTSPPRVPAQTGLGSNAQCDRQCQPYYRYTVLSGPYRPRDRRTKLINNMT